MEAMSAALKADRDSTSAAHLKIAPYQEKEDIQDFLEAFEGIMKIQKVKETDWVSHTFTQWESTYHLYQLWTLYELQGSKRGYFGSSQH